MTYYPAQVIIYDEDDHIITVLTSKKDVKAFLNGYYGNIIGMDHYEIVY